MRRLLPFAGAVAFLLGTLQACDSSRGYDDDDDGNCTDFNPDCDEATGSGAGSGSGNGGTATSGGDGTVQQQCVDIINNYRASVGRPPLARWVSAESCSDAEALSDGMSNTPHGAFGACDEFAQNECPGWPGPESELIVGCLDLMWDEGPGGGHYDNMENPQYTEVACGFATMGDGSIWAVQNFR
jgi:hypothetical protein